MDGFTRKDGRIFPISVVSVPLFEGDKFVGTVAAFQDISARKSDEEFLLSTSSRLSALIESMQSGVVVEDENHMMVMANQALFNLFGVEDMSMDAIGQPALQILDECRDCITTIIHDCFSRKHKNLVIIYKYSILLTAQ